MALREVRFDQPQPRVSYAIDKEGVALVEMLDYDGRNALSEDLVGELKSAFASVIADSASKVIVLLGTDEVFSSGAPKEFLLRLVNGTAKPTELRLPELLLDAPLPTIAAMEGHAVGGGFALGLSADIILMANESRYGCNFMDLGLTPGMGTTRLLEHVLSPALAHELLYTGELRLGSAFAHNGGFNYVLPWSEVRPRALDIAARIAEKPRPALEALKRTLSAPRRQIFQHTLTSESMMHQIVLRDDATRRSIEEQYIE